MRDLVTTSPEIELLRRANEAFNRREVESVLAMMRVDVDWSNGMEGGRMSGRDVIREYWNRQFESVNSLVEPQAFTPESGGRVAARVHQLVRDRSGTVILDRMVDHVCTIRDRQIARMDIRELIST